MKEFRPLSALLTAALPSGGDVPAPDRIQQKLARCWREQTGAAALHSRPLLFTSGRLVVFVESASWGTEIRHRSGSLMEVLVADGLRISTVEVKVLPDSPAPARKRAGKPRRLSPQNAGQIEQLAGTIEHPQLKASLLRLAKRADKGQDKGQE